MATVDHLDAPYVRTPPKTENLLAHSRNLSTISNVTLFTTTTNHSHPTEPLLPATIPQTVNYDDQIPTMERPPCEIPLMMHDNPVNEGEEKGYWARDCRRPLKRWKWLKLGLQAVLSVWAIYNTVRYLIAFSDSGDSTNQIFCLALGTSTGVSFLLTFFSFFLAISGRNRHVYAVTPNYLLYLGRTMDYLSSFFLIGPAVVNFAVIFIWKDSFDSHSNSNNWCHLDVDLLWSVSNTPCNNKSPGWAIWLILSALRLALTLIISIGFHVISPLCYHRPRAIRRFRAQISKPSTPKPAPSSSNLPHRDLVTLQSDSTLCGTSKGEPSPQSRIRLAHSHSSNLSQDVSLTEPTISTLDHSVTTEFEDEHEANELVDRSQSLVPQTAQETEEALDLVRLEHPPSPEDTSDILSRDLPPSYEDDVNETRVSHNNIFNLPPIFPVLGYNEFGLPYPPDQNVRMLNGYIRRMPTIESMGSGEVGSSVGSSNNRARESILTASRPPTRSTLLSQNSTDHDPPESEPPSRTNSLSARAELLVGLSSVPGSISEHGELLEKTSPVAQRLSTPISYVDHTVGDTYSSAASGTSSYHTATSESFLPPGSPMDPQSLFGQWDLIIPNSGHTP